MSCPKNTSELLHLKKQFLCCTPAKEIMWNDDFLHKLCNSSDSLAYQKLLLENTVNQSLVKKFGLKLTYQQTFIKYIINKLESSEKEVLDELYNTYCKLLNDSSNDTDTHYRHFILDCHGIDCITLKESSKVISQGTTGLCSWQASLALADWCLHNYQYFYGKCVLELGSGVGLTGLVVSLCCHPSSYWFSDCHPSVLHMLQSNIILNTNKKDIADENSNCDISETFEENIHHKLCICEKKSEKNPCCQSSVVYRTEYNGTEIGVLDLPWENIPSNEVTQHILPELILAADVVFDSRLFKALSQAFCHLLKKPCSILLACTVRNEDTLKSFMEMLRSEGLKIYEEQLLPPNCILYSNVVPVKLYRILGSITSDNVEPCTITAIAVRHINVLSSVFLVCLCIILHIIYMF